MLSGNIDETEINIIWPGVVGVLLLFYTPYLYNVFYIRIPESNGKIAYGKDRNINAFTIEFEFLFACFRELHDLSDFPDKIVGAGSTSIMLKRMG